MSAATLTAPSPVACLEASPYDAVRTANWQEPLYAWFFTRVVCFIAMYLGAWYGATTIEFSTMNPGAGFIEDLSAYFRDYAANPQKYGQRPMLGVRVGGPWLALDPFLRWDSVWYLSIAEVGYVAGNELKAQQNIAFFPVYPLMIRGLAALGISSVFGALLISNLATLLAMRLLYGLALRRYGLEQARWSLALWSVFPTSIFGCVGYADSLLALVSILSLGELLEGRYVICGLWNGIASAIRPPGLLLGLSLLPGLFRRRWWPALIGGVLSGLGTLAYFGYLGAITGDPLAYLGMGEYWREGVRSWNPIDWCITIAQLVRTSIILMIHREPDYLVYSSHVVEPFLVVWALWQLPKVRRLGWGVLLASFAPMAMILSTGTLTSLARYSWAIVPLFLVAGTSLAQSRFRWFTLVVFAALMVWLSYLYGGCWEVI